MSIKVNFIEANKGICRNNAFSVLETNKGQENTPFTIIPAYEISDHNARNTQSVKKAFEQAKDALGNKPQKDITSYARTLLGRKPFTL